MLIFLGYKFTSLGVYKFRSLEGYRVNKKNPKVVGVSKNIVFLRRFSKRMFRGGKTL
jgi:hypothetical protein